MATYDKYEFFKTVKKLRAQEKPWAEIGNRYGIQGNTAQKRYEICRALFEGDTPNDDLPDVEGFHVDGNYATLVQKGDRVTSIPQLLERFKVDLEEWAVDHAIVETWEMGRRKETKHITWVGDGVIGEGSEVVDTGEISPYTLYLCKAWLVRKHPVSVTPFINPIRFDYKPRPKPPRRGKAEGLHVGLAIPDAQIGYERDLNTGELDPFHDRIALDIAVQIAAIKPFDFLAILGDWLDLTGWTDKFARKPEHNQTTQASIIEGSWWLYQLAVAAARARKVFIEGNHEVRMPKYMAKMLAEACNLKPATKLDMPAALEVQSLLGLDDLGYEWFGGYPDAKVWLNDKLCLTHGDKVASPPGAAARKMVDNTSHSTIFGHIHRRERATRLIETRNGNKVYTAYSPGCLCRLDGVVPGSDKQTNWQQGLAVVYYDPNGEYHSIEPIEINKGLAVWGGEVFMGRDRLDDLCGDTGYKFGA